MTNNRTNGKTATGRRRPSSGKGGALTASMLPGSAVPVEPAPVVAAPVELAPAPVTTARPSTTKYTANLDDTTALAFDELALQARRAKGRPIDKSELLAVLVMLAADDAALREQVFSLLADKRPRGNVKR